MNWKHKQSETRESKTKEISLKNIGVKVLITKKKAITNTATNAKTRQKLDDKNTKTKTSPRGNTVFDLKINKRNEGGGGEMENFMKQNN